MSPPSDATSGASLDDVDLSSPEAPTASSAPVEPGWIALPQPSDASAHVPGDDEEQRSIGGDSEALISKAGGVNEASQVLGAQSRPSSSEFTLGPSNAGGSSGSTSATAGGAEASVRPPVLFRGAFPMNRHAHDNTPVRYANAGFLPRPRVGGNGHRFNSDNGCYRNRRYHERGAHGWNGGPPPVAGPNLRMWMPMPQLQGNGQPFNIAPYAFMPHQASPFASPIGYTDFTSPYTPPAPAALETYYALPPPFLETYYVCPPPLSPPQLVLKEQIEYYFSVDNLYKDVFLRSNMDARGWVPVSLIATFRRVKSVTSNTAYILSALRNSIVIEIQGENIRRRNDWKRWILPSANGRDGQPSDSTASTSGYDSVIGDFSRQSL